MFTHLPILGGCFVIFGLWLCYELKKDKRHTDQNNAEFWAREAAANNTRRVNPDTLPYIQVPLENFPLGKYDDEDLRQQELTLQELSQKKILNLTGMTSTQLKETYGPANLPLLDECDMNFTELAKTVYRYGLRLHELGKEDDAVTVLEYGISILTDISGNYKLLASLYFSRGENEKISALKTSGEKLNSLMKASILASLEEYGES